MWQGDLSARSSRGRPTELARAMDGRPAHGRSARRFSVAGKGLTFYATPGAGRDALRRCFCLGLNCTSPDVRFGLCEGAFSLCGMRSADASARSSARSDCRAALACARTLAKKLGLSSTPIASGVDLSDAMGSVESEADGLQLLVVEVKLCGNFMSRVTSASLALAGSPGGGTLSVSMAASDMLMVHSMKC